jgi:hypothetical protein
MNCCSRCKKQFTLKNHKTCLACRDYNRNYREKIPRVYKQGQYSSKDNLMKTCSDCLENKHLNLFYQNKRYKDGYRNQCIECHSKRWKTYYSNKYKNVLKERLFRDEIYRLKQNQRTYLHQQLKKQDVIKTKNTNMYLGCSSEILKKWLTFQFNEGMNWENKTWQIDHVVPVSLFNLKDENEQCLAFHWSNLQPLSRFNNISKSNRLIPIQYVNSIINACRFIKLNKLNNIEYDIIRKRLQWIKTKFSLRHFQIAGTPL